MDAEEVQVLRPESEGEGTFHIQPSCHLHEFQRRQREGVSPEEEKGEALKKPNRIVFVEWEDPTGNSKWAAIEDARENTPIQCVSVGLLISDSKKNLVLAASYCEENMTVADVTVMPRSAVRSMRTISTMRPKKKGKR